MSFDFEGDEVTEFTAQLPSATLQAPDAYQRGTLLTLQVQVRVKSVRIEEDRKGNLSRKHVLALEEVNVTDVLTPTQRKALIEAAAQAEPSVPEEYTVVEEGHPLEDDRALAAAVEANTLSEQQIDDAIEEMLGDPDDEDSEHSWMDDDEATDGLNVDLSALA